MCPFGSWKKNMLEYLKVLTIIQTGSWETSAAVNKKTQINLCRGSKWWSVTATEQHTQDTRGCKWLESSSNWSLVTSYSRVINQLVCCSSVVWLTSNKQTDSDYIWSVVTMLLQLQQNFFFRFCNPMVYFCICCVVLISRGRVLLEDREEIWVKTSSGIRDSPFDPQAH